MNKIKTTKEHTIYQKRSGRYAVKDHRKHWLHGDDKVAVLAAEGLVKTPEPKPAAPEAEAPPAEEPSEESAQ